MMMEARQVKTAEPKTSSEDKKQTTRSGAASHNIFQLYLTKADDLLNLNNQPPDNKNNATGDKTDETQTNRSKTPGEDSSQNTDRQKTASNNTDTNPLLLYLPGFNLLSDNLLQQLQLARMLEINSTAAIDWTGLVDRLVAKVQLSKGVDMTNLEIVLKPDWLGKLTLKLNWQDGLVNINLAAEAKVKEILEANLEALKNALASQGVNLGQLETSLNQQNKNDDRAADQIPAEIDSLSSTGSDAPFIDLDLLYQVGQRSGVGCNLVRMVV